MFGTWIRRTLKAALVGALAALVAAWFRERNDEPVPEEPGDAEWPPLDLSDTASAVTSAPPDTTVIEDVPAPQATPSVPSPAAAPSPAPADPRPADASGTWVDPDAEGDCPSSHPVKLKLSSGIFHVPGGASYERTNADRCYCTAEDAESDGYRASKT